MKKKKNLKIVGVVLSVIVLILIIGACYLKFFLPNIKVKDINVEITPERVERGEYLANHVMVCIDCHSTRDWTKYSGPIKPGTNGMGGDVFDQSVGAPGVYYATNITPYELAEWSDGEIYRAITAGVGKRNNAIFPIMPYVAYGKLDDEDIFSVIAYLRSIPSIENKVPVSKSDFPVNFIINTLPVEGQPVKRPEKQVDFNYGEYITIAAACIDCHTPVNEKAELIMEKAYSGGREFKLSETESILSTNITFDKNTGLGDWDKETFIEVFKSYSPDIYDPDTVNMGDNTPMPWVMYSGMDTTDLEAIFVYLESLQPIEN